MVVAVSTAAREHSHSLLKIVKSKLQSTMGQQRLNALILLYMDKDILIIDIYANRYPRMMLLTNQLAQEQLDKERTM